MTHAEKLASWGAPPISLEEDGLNPEHLQRLRYNPEYEDIKQEDLRVGDDIIVGTYASNRDGSPNIRWQETKVEDIPMNNFNGIPIIEIRRKKNGTS